MFCKTKISLNLTGLVLFDPVVLNDFVLAHKIEDSNLLDFFNQNPEIGNEAINKGIMLPVYTIEAWDYHIIINTDQRSIIKPEWELFKTDIAFPLNIRSGNCIVSDIYAILEWNPDYYLNFPSKDERVGVDDNFDISAGNYAVKILGFRDKNNPDIENRECGYEFIFTEVNKMPIIKDINIDSFNFKVDGISEGSW